MSKVVQLFPEKCAPPEGRWRVELCYRFEGGVKRGVIYIEELEELQGIIEKGPHFDTIVSLTITVADPSIADLTVEGSLEL